MQNEEAESIIRFLEQRIPLDNEEKLFIRTAVSCAFIRGEVAQVKELRRELCAN
jgi:hypothetical protein